jgi:hypothetical protein
MMSKAAGVGRATAAGVAFGLAAVSGVVAAFVVEDASDGLWIALGALIVVGALLQGWVTFAEREARPKVVASGAAAVSIGGTAHADVTTMAEGGDRAAQSAGGDVSATAPGAVSIGEDAWGHVSTQSTNPDGSSKT